MMFLQVTIFFTSLLNFSAAKDIKVVRATGDYIRNIDNCDFFNSSKTKDNACSCSEPSKGTMFSVHGKFRCASRQEISRECRSYIGNSVPLLRKSIGNSWTLTGLAVTDGTNYCKKKVAIWNNDFRMWQFWNARVEVKFSLDKKPPTGAKKLKIAITSTHGQTLAGLLIKITSSCDFNYKDCLLLKAEGEFQYKNIWIPPTKQTSSSYMKSTTAVNFSHSSSTNETYIILGATIGVVIVLVLLLVFWLRFKMSKWKLKAAATKKVKTNPAAVTMSRLPKNTGDAKTQYNHYKKTQPYDYVYSNNIKKGQLKTKKSKQQQQNHSKLENDFLKCSTLRDQPIDTYEPVNQQTSYASLANVLADEYSSIDNTLEQKYINDNQSQEYTELNNTNVKGTFLLGKTAGEEYSQLDEDAIPGAYSELTLNKTNSVYSELSEDGYTEDYTTLVKSRNGNINPDFIKRMRRFSPKHFPTVQNKIKVSTLINKLEGNENKPNNGKTEPVYWKTEPEYFETVPEYSYAQRL